MRTYVTLIYVSFVEPNPTDHREVVGYNDCIVLTSLIGQ